MASETLPVAVPHTECSDPSREEVGATQAIVPIDDVGPEFGVGCAVEGGDEASENGVEHLGPQCGLVAELREAVEPGEKAKPVGLFP